MQGSRTLNKLPTTASSNCHILCEAAVSEHFHSTLVSLIVECHTQHAPGSSNLPSASVNVLAGCCRGHVIETTAFKCKGASYWLSESLPLPKPRRRCRGEHLGHRHTGKEEAARQERLKFWKGPSRGSRSVACSGLSSERAPAEAAAAVTFSALVHGRAQLPVPLAPAVANVAPLHGAAAARLAAAVAVGRRRRLRHVGHSCGCCYRFLVPVDKGQRAQVEACCAWVARAREVD